MSSHHSGWTKIDPTDFSGRTNLLVAVVFGEAEALLLKGLGMCAAVAGLVGGRLDAGNSS